MRFASRAVAAMTASMFSKAVNMGLTEQSSSLPSERAVTAEIPSRRVTAMAAAMILSLENCTFGGITDPPGH